MLTCLNKQHELLFSHTLNFDEEGSPKSWSCSCVAGAAICHHTVAVLYQLQDYQRRGLKSVPPLVSKTSLPQIWHVPTRSCGIKKRSSLDLVVQKPKKPAEPSTCKQQRLDTGVRSTLYNPVTVPLDQINLPNLLCPYMNSLEWTTRPQFSQIWQMDEPQQMVDSKFGLVPRGSLLSYHLKKEDSSSSSSFTVSSIPNFILPDYSELVKQYVSDLSDDLRRKFNSLSVTVEQSTEYERLTREQSSSTEWFNIRKHRLTASLFKRICSRRTNYDKLANDLNKQRHVMTAAMKQGIENEPIAADNYSKAMGHEVHKVGFVINPSVFFLGCSPDRRVYDASCDEWGLLEIKCPQIKSVDEIKYLEYSRSGADNLPRYKLKTNHDYYYQIMGQLGLTGSAWCDFFVHLGDQYHCERINYDDEFFKCNIMQKLLPFYFNHYLSVT